MKHKENLRVSSNVALPHENLSQTASFILKRTFNMVNS